MNYVLFVIALNAGGHTVDRIGDFDSMDLCFDKRDEIVEELGRPIVNYQAVCVLDTKSVKI